MCEERLRVTRLDQTSVVRRAGQRRLASTQLAMGCRAESEERCGSLVVDSTKTCPAEIWKAEQ